MQVSSRDRYFTMFFLASLKLALFRWKILRKRHWVLFILEFLVPAILFFLLAYGRCKISKYSPTVIGNVTDPAEVSSDLLLTSYFDMTDIHMFYTPITPWTVNLMKQVQIKFQLENNVIKGFKSENDLMEYYADNNDGTIIAILFNTANDKHLEYTLRIHKGDMIWDTNRLFDMTPNYIPEMGSSNYIYNDILALQFALDSSYIELLGNYTEMPYNFLFQELPYPPYKSDTFLKEMCMTYLPWITLFSFIPLCLEVLKHIVEEKHTGGKELLKVAGLTPSTLYSGWFLHAFITYFISVSLIVCLMKFPLFGASYSPIEHCNGFIYFIFLLSYCTASIVFCVAMSTLFNKASIAMMCLILVWFLSYLIPMSLVNETTPWWSKMFLSLLPNMALYFGYSEISVYEIRESDLNFDNWTIGGDECDQALSIVNVLTMFVVQVILYAAMTIYLDSVYPGEYGLPKKWNYPIPVLKQLISRMLKKIFIRGHHAEETNLPIDVEECITTSKGIEIKELVKQFGKKAAVNGLSLDISNGQITVLLGHNGAGKTTTMSIITGMVRATSGAIWINGKDIRFNMDEIRKEMGWCSQHNLLFPDFTVSEHFVYFGLLRGMNRSTAEENAKDWIGKLGLKGKENDLAVNLSGGMKRKLCLGLALTGNTEILILDEPTTGMDPESRKKIWDMLKNERGGRTILITTHFMEEADALSDKIAIMGNGKLIEYSTPIDLKKKYGTGYHLSLTLGSNQRMLKKELTKNFGRVLDDVRKSTLYALKKQLIREIHSANDTIRRSNQLLPQEQLSAKIRSVIHDVEYFFREELIDKIGSVIDDSRKRITFLLKEQLTGMIRSVIDDARLESHNGNNLVYILPMNATTRFPMLFTLLENFRIVDTTDENSRHDENSENDSIETESSESPDGKYKQIVEALSILENTKTSHMKAESSSEKYKQILQEWLMLLENIKSVDANYKNLEDNKMKIESRESSDERCKQTILELIELLENFGTSDANHEDLDIILTEMESNESSDNEYKRIDQKLSLSETSKTDSSNYENLRSNSTKIESKGAEYRQIVYELSLLEDISIGDIINENPISNMSVSITTLDEVFQRCYDRFIVESKSKLSHVKRNDQHGDTNNERPESTDSFETKSKESSDKECKQNLQKLFEQLQNGRFDENSKCGTMQINAGNSSQEKYEIAMLLRWLINSLLPLAYKRVWFIRRKFLYQTIFLIIAVIFMVLAAYLSNPNGFYERQEPEIEFNLKKYGETKVFYEVSGISNSEVATNMNNSYQSVAKNQTAEVLKVMSLKDAVIEKGKENIVYYKYHMVVAAAFRNTDIYVMYGNRALHGAPISLNIVMNAVLKTLFGSDHSIKTIFSPLHGIGISLPYGELSEMRIGFIWMFLVPIAISFLMGSFLLFLNKEHITNFSQLQFRTGVTVSCYWLSNFLFDFIVLYLPSVILLSLSIGLIELFRSVDIIGTLVVLLSCYGAACIPFTYLFSFKKSISSSFSLFLIIGLFAGIVPTLAITTMDESFDEYYKNLASTLKYIFFPLFPHFGLTYTILKFSRKIIQNHNWLVMNVEKRNLLCINNPNPCCFDDAVECDNFKSYFINETHGIRDELAMAFVPCIVYLGIVIFVDSIYVKKMVQSVCFLSAPKLNPTKKSGTLEKRRKYMMFAEDLYKWFSGKPIVKGVNFGVGPGKCFGLLGVNGAGKTTTFKMLTHEEIYDAGKVGIQDGEKEINIENTKYFQKVSYCPQYDALNDVLSAKEQLKFVAMVKRFDGAVIEELADRFLDILGLTPYKDIPSGDLSGGNKRKLALGMALMGDHKYTLLDEPTSGVDPFSRRKIWTIIDAWKMNKNAAFILTSHSMDECEALCDDIAIMKKGKVSAKGTIDELKKEHNTGFTLKVKLKALDRLSCNIEMENIKENTPGGSHACLECIHNNVEGRCEVDRMERASQSRANQLYNDIKDTFCMNDEDRSDVKLVDRHDSMLHFHLKGERNWSELFNKIEELKQRLPDGIEDYTLSGTSLEDVFLMVARTPEDKEESGSSIFRNILSHLRCATTM